MAGIFGGVKMKHGPHAAVREIGGSAIRAVAGSIAHRPQGAGFAR